MTNGAKLFYTATHSCDGTLDPKAELRFENAVITNETEGGRDFFLAKFADGKTKVYGEVAFTEDFGVQKIKAMLNAVRSGDYSGISCSAETVLPFTRLYNAFFELAPVNFFPAEKVGFNESGRYIEGLFEDCVFCHEKDLLPREVGYEWAGKLAEIDLTSYKRFEGMLSVDTHKET